MATVVPTFSAGAFDSPDVQAHIKALAAEVVPAGGNSQASVTYANGAWPTRPDSTGSVLWIDPTGSAPRPAGMVTGDVFMVTNSAVATGPQELLTAGEQAFGLPWTASGAAAITPGVHATVSASGDTVTYGDLPVAAGRSFTWTVASDQPATLAWQTWGGGSPTGNDWNSDSAMTLAGTIPAGSQTINLLISGKGAAATMTAASFTQARS